MEGIGAGLAALAFWGFVAAIIAVGVWDGAKKREVQHETLRQMIASGKPLDDKMRDALLGKGFPGAGNGFVRPEHGLRIAAIIVLSVAVGIAILGVFVGQLAPNALMPILGAAALVLCIGVGLLVAAAYTRRMMAEDAASAGNPPKSG